MAKTKTTERKWREGSPSDQGRARELLDAMKSGGVRYDKLETSRTKFVSNFRRICPPTGSMEDWYQIVPVHFGIGPNKRSVICLRLTQISDFCPACTLGFEFLEQGDKKRGSSILPSWRIYINVMKLNQDGTLEDDKPYVLTINQTQFENLLDEFKDNGDMTHIETGRNVNFKAKEIEKGGFKFNELKFKVTDEVLFPGDVSTLDELEDVTEIVPVVDAAEMVALLEGGVSNTALPSGDPMGQDSKVQEEKTEVVSGGFNEDDDEALVENKPEVVTEEESEAPQKVNKSVTPASDPTTAIDRLRAQVQKKNGN